MINKHNLIASLESMRNKIKDMEDKITSIIEGLKEEDETEKQEEKQKCRHCNHFFCETEEEKRFGYCRYHLKESQEYQEFMQEEKTHKQNMACINKLKEEQEEKLKMERRTKGLCEQCGVNKPIGEELIPYSVCDEYPEGRKCTIHVCEGCREKDIQEMIEEEKARRKAKQEPEQEPNGKDEEDPGNQLGNLKQGICTLCGEFPATNGFAICDGCQVKQGLKKD